jgi:hypothetical protein
MVLANVKCGCCNLWKEDFCGHSVFHHSSISFTRSYMHPQKPSEVNYKDWETFRFQKVTNAVDDVLK